MNGANGPPAAPMMDLSQFMTNLNVNAPLFTPVTNPIENGIDAVPGKKKKKNKKKAVDPASEDTAA